MGSEYREPGTFLLMMEETMRPRQPTVLVMSLAAYISLDTASYYITRYSDASLVCRTQGAGLTRDTAAHILHDGANLLCRTEHRLY